MSTSAFLAHSGIWNADDSVIAKVKLATLLYDRVIHSGPFEPVEFAVATAQMRNEPKLTSEARDSAAASWTKVPQGVPMYDLWGPEAIQTLREAPPALDLATTEALLQRGLSPREHIDDGKLQIYTMLEILYWRKHLPSVVFIGHDISDVALKKFAAPLVASGEGVEAEAACPNVFDLTWNDIFSLRNSPFLSSFRNKYNELEARGNVALLLDHYREGLERVADEVRPSTKRAAGLAVLSNLPIPVVNPFHVGHSAYEVWHQAHLTKHFGWVFFLREASKLVGPSQDG